ncbi:MAG: hypothetical protein H0X33_11750 [Taibaiella sp.]|nr:hypothetical protein [Taibaiella sp.]
MSLFSSEKPVTQPYTVKDKQLTCQHCGNDQFFKHKSIIYFLGELMNGKSTCFICSKCTHMHWFKAVE